jgi:hypothetical protein
VLWRSFGIKKVRKKFEKSSKKVRKKFEKSSKKVRKKFEKSLKSSFKRVGRNEDKEMLANVNGIFSAFIQCQRWLEVHLLF